MKIKRISSKIKIGKVTQEILIFKIENLKIREKVLVKKSSPVSFDALNPKP